MMKQINTKIPLIGLFLLVAIFALLLTMYSANIYNDIVNNDSRYDTANMAATYITEKLRQNGLEKPIEIFDRGIMIHGDDQIDTAIYHYDGYLYEASIYADKELKLGSGEALFSIKDITILLEDNMLTITVQDDEREITKRIRIYDQR